MKHKRSWQQMARDVSARWAPGGGSRGDSHNNANTRWQGTTANAAAGTDSIFAGMIPTGATAAASPLPKSNQGGAAAAASGAASMATNANMNADANRPTGTRPAASAANVNTGSGPPPAQNTNATPPAEMVNAAAATANNPQQKAPAAAQQPAGSAKGAGPMQQTQASPSTATNAAAAAPPASAANATPKPGTGSGTAPLDPIAGQNPAGGQAGSPGGKNGQANLYVDPNDVPSDMAEAADYAGFKRDYLHKYTGEDEDEDVGENDGTVTGDVPSSDTDPVKDGYGWAYSADSDGDEDQDYDAAAGGSWSEYGYEDSEGGSSDETMDKREQQGDDMEGVGAGEWKKQVEERLAARSARRGLVHDSA